MNSRAIHLTAAEKNSAGDAARLHPISPALVSGNPAWFQNPAAPGSKSASGDPFAGRRIKKSSAPPRVRIQTHQKLFALNEPIYEGKS